MRDTRMDFGMLGQSWVGYFVASHEGNFPLQADPKCIVQIVDLS